MQLQYPLQWSQQEAIGFCCPELYAAIAHTPTLFLSYVMLTNKMDFLN